LNRLTEKLAVGEPVYGPFMKLSSPTVVEILARVGFDFVIVDREHGTFSFEAVENLVRAADAYSMGVIVRLRSLLPREVGLALDCGATGIMAPMIETAEMAQELVNLSLFPPLGRRGVDGTSRLGGYSLISMAEATKRQENTLVVLAQIETKRGLQHLESILAVSGLTGIFVGPSDLSWSLGYPGDLEAPEVTEACSRIIAAARARELVAGIYARDRQAVEKWAGQGVRLFGLSSDVAFLRDGARSALGTG
jgi:4-hydroxy-2-oxoheptanedioate aldolase